MKTMKMYFIDEILIQIKENLENWKKKILSLFLYLFYLFWKEILKE